MLVVQERYLLYETQRKFNSSGIVKFLESAEGTCLFSVTWHTGHIKKLWWYFGGGGEPANCRVFQLSRTHPTPILHSAR